MVVKRIDNNENTAISPQCLSRGVGFTALSKGRRLKIENLSGKAAFGFRLCLKRPLRKLEKVKMGIQENIKSEVNNGARLEEA